MSKEGRRGATVSAEDLHRFCVEALEKNGVRNNDARTTAEVLVTTDSIGVYTHGTALLPGYVRRLQGGGLRAQGTPGIVDEGPAWAVVDGDSALGQVTSTFAMKTAIGKARASGIGYVGVRNSCHFGAAGYYAWLATKENMIGLAMANDRPTVAAPGSRRAVTGSNPLAYAVPTGGGDPILLDISVGTVAGGKVYAAQRQGIPIPDDWIIGPDGRPTTDKSLFPHSAALAPMAGHKGYGLAILIETLAAVLTGAAITWRVENWITSDPSFATGHGAAFLAIDVTGIMPLEMFLERIDSLVDEIHKAPKIEDAEKIYLPGEMEWERRKKALNEGIPLPSDIAANLLNMAREQGMDTTIFKNWEGWKDG